MLIIDNLHISYYNDTNSYQNAEKERVPHFPPYREFLSAERKQAGNGRTWLWSSVAEPAGQAMTGLPVTAEGHDQCLKRGPGPGRDKQKWYHG